MTVEELVKKLTALPAEFQKCTVRICGTGEDPVADSNDIARDIPVAILEKNPVVVIWGEW